MKDFIVYSNITGEILRQGRCQGVDILLQPSNTNESVIEASDSNDNIHKIDLNTLEIIFKIPIPVIINKTTISADGVDNIIISDLPNPTAVSIVDEGSWEITDGVFEFTTETVGEYIIKLRSSLYLDVEYLINAN